MSASARVLPFPSSWSWLRDTAAGGRRDEQVYVLRKAAAAVALLVVPLPYRGQDSEHLALSLRWMPFVLAGYPSLGLSGAVDPLEASGIAWLTPLGEREWSALAGASPPDLNLEDGTVVRFPVVPLARPQWPRHAG
jgi:hypothetical protein